VPGTEVKIVGTAPLGDPINLVARGYNLTIRKNEASMVIVRVVDG
ncbi:MAG: FeoA family protein, partial [Candidatus Asgardarchaeia archaeon]